MEEKRGKIKLAVFDLDGTLLDSNDSIQEKNGEALRALYQAGVKIMISSGRAPLMAEAYFYEAGVKGILSCANGAYIIDSDEAVIYQNAIPVDAVALLVEMFIREKIQFSLMTEQNVYIDRIEETPRDRFLKYEALARKHGLPFPLLQGELTQIDYLHTPIYKIPVIELQKDKLDERLHFLQGISKQIEVTRSGSQIIDVTAAGVSKGMAVRIVAEHLGIQKEEICCMGDYDNDISMFREAGLSVAMGNAAEHVKAEADYVTTDHNMGGVADAIMRYMLPQTEK